MSSEKPLCIRVKCTSCGWEEHYYDSTHKEAAAEARKDHAKRQESRPFRACNQTTFTQGRADPPC